jgi:hypothetical protein
VEQLGDGGQHWLDDLSHDRDGQDHEDHLWQAVAAAAVGARRQDVPWWGSQGATVSGLRHGKKTAA